MRKQNLYLLIFFPILLFGFQNCGNKSLQFEDKDFSSKLSFFDYRYKAATPVYFEARVVPLAGSTAGVRTIQIVGLITPSDGSTKDVDYRIEIYDSNGSLACPTIQRLLTSGNTLLNEQCVAVDTVKVTKVNLKVLYEGTWYDFEQQFDAL